MEKCAFRKTSLKFLGHMIDQDGIRADPDKTAAIQRMETPKSITDLRRFMGMVNQLGKFSPNISDLNQPLRALLSTKKCLGMGPRAGARLRAHQGRIGQADSPGTVRPESQNQGVSRRFLIWPRGGPLTTTTRGLLETGCVCFKINE